MAVILGLGGQVFSPHAYANEASFEADVVRLADQIFGPSTIYVDVKKRIGNDIVTIPDGYLIDVTAPAQPKLYIVENEIVSHDPFKHIGIQMLKFVTSFDEAQRPIRMFLMDSIRKNAKSLARLESARAQSSSPNVDHYLDQAVYGEFRGLVVIDEAREELFRVLEKINANISVLELKAFHADSGEALYQFDTLYDEVEEVVSSQDETPPKAEAADKRLARQLRRAESDTVIVPAREEGFQEVFLGESQWRAIRIGPAMKDRIKYIAAYRIAPVSAVTHIAEVQEIRPNKDTGKYQLIFKSPAQEIRHVGLAEAQNKPQGPVYVKRERLLSAKTLEDALK
ncbi:MAG: hypothetical protein WA190_15235 [Usitatibacter sp.]